ncbi:CopD family protein [Rubrimonas cliftonensis]|uniref:Copper transport protein n=1 Tax=Rubrimonas cliftonensis TaxID=89524 RepID=A0A1H4EYH9_9RHOB|nr:CopD family protein [Rubrimonas cliftonensis]SEA90093.1 copper transport protein [Rubrimonas cliftonensis]
MILRVLSLVALLLGLAPAALAHAQLRAATPVAGAVLAAAPAEVRLQFNEPVAALTFRWVSPDGRLSEPAVAVQGDTVRVIPPPDAARGTHLLSWRVTSADGHPVGGTHLFSVGAPSATADATAAETAGARLAAFARIILFAGLALGIGAAAFAALVAPPARSVRRLATAGAIAVAPAAMALTGAEGLDRLGAPPSRLADAAVWAEAAQAPASLSALLWTLAAALAAVALVRPRATLGLAALGLGALGFAASGHAASVSPRWLTGALVATHAAALLVWLGALTPLAAALARDRSGAAPVVRRFAAVAAPMLALLALSGAALVWTQLRAPADLLSTGYGQLLALKLALVAGMLGLAALNRFVLAPRLTGGAAAPMRLRRSILVEIGLGLAVLCCAAAFRLTPPPRALEAGPAPVAIHLHGRLAMADLAVSPARVGLNTVVATVLDADFAPLTPLSVTVGFAPQDGALEAVRVEAVRGDDGVWRAEAVLPLPGAWSVIVDVLVSDFDRERLGGDFFVAP